MSIWACRSHWDEENCCWIAVNRVIFKTIWCFVCPKNRAAIFLNAVNTDRPIFYKELNIAYCRWDDDACVDIFGTVKCHLLSKLRSFVEWPFLGFYWKNSHLCVFIYSLCRHKKTNHSSLIRQAKYLYLGGTNHSSLIC